MEVLGILLFLFYILKIIFHFSLLFNKSILEELEMEKSGFIDSLVSPANRQICLWFFYSGIMFPIFSNRSKKKGYKVLANMAVGAFFLIFGFILFVGYTQT